MHVRPPSRPPEPGLAGRTFGPYRVLSLIQRGGMGEIYLAELAPQRVRVVLKRLQEVHTDDERYVEMFRAEAAVMSELDHPNIVKVLGTPVIEGKQCLIMEFVRGRNLQQLLSRLRKLGRMMPPSLAVHIARKVLLGLHEAHEARLPDGRPLSLVHRDVKPGNVLVSFAGDVKITDFGIAKSAMQNRLTTAGVVKGTVRYLSPEQIRSEKITLRSDLFSCASVLMEVLTDRPLFDRGPVAPTLMAILNDDRAPVTQLLPFRAPDLAAVLERALAPRPEARFATALEMSQALGTAARALGPAVTSDDVGGLLRKLFQGGSEPGATPAEEVTYLLGQESAPRPAVPARPRGAEPLDAGDFGQQLGFESQQRAGSVAEVMSRAEARADALLDDQIRIAEPSWKQESESLDLEIDETPEARPNFGAGEAAKPFAPGPGPEDLGQAESEEGGSHRAPEPALESSGRYRAEEPGNGADPKIDLRALAVAAALGSALTVLAMYGLGLVELGF